MKFLTRVSLAVAVAGAAVLGPVALAVPAQAATSCKSQVFRYGSQGTCVKYIQQILNTKGLGGGTDNGQIATDGIFGWGTHGRVIDLQSRNALVQDGVVGSATWSVLCQVQGSKSAAQRAAGC